MAKRTQGARTTLPRADSPLARRDSHHHPGVCLAPIRHLRLNGYFGLVEAKQLIGADVEGLGELNEDFGGGKFRDGFVAGDAALRRIDELGELDLGEAASHAQLSQAAAKGGIRGNLFGHASKDKGGIGKSWVGH